jgi:hypothetical protein
MRAGFLNAQWWPAFEFTQNDDGKIISRNVTDEKKVFIPKYILSLPQQKIVYHYTTVRGFFGIITENAVWASHIRYMNDASEVTHGKNMALSIISKMALKKKYGEFASILLMVADILSHETMPDYFVASFSLKNDDLTQWRSYGGSQGICIGFDLNTINSQLHFWSPDMQVALYSEKQKISLMILYIKIYFREFCKDKEFYNEVFPSGWYRSYAESLANKLKFQFIRYKHKCFESEHEVRLVVGEREGEYQPVRYRVRGNMIIPYHRSSDRIWGAQGAGAEFPKLPIASVTIGPMVNQELSAHSVREFLSSHGYDPAIVDVSALPYRSV